MQFHLGPPGRLFALPVIERDGDVPAPAEASGGVFTSLTGAKSQDRIGPYRRTWELPYLYLGRDDFDLLDALRRGHLGGPLRLIDPQFPNLLSPQIATGGTDDASVAGFTAMTGARRYVRPSTIPADLRAVGAIEWTAPTALDELSTGRELAQNRLPAPPQGRAVCVAARMMRSDSPATAPVVPCVDSWDAAGSRFITYPSASRSVDGAWSDVTYLTTLPVQAVEWAPAWRSPAGAGAAFYVAGLRAAFGSTVPTPDRGGGAAEVFITGLPLTYPSQDEYSFTLNLEEC